MNEDKLFTAWFAFCAVLSVAWLAFLVWAIYSIVQWVTSQ